MKKDIETKDQDLNSFNKSDKSTKSFLIEKPDSKKSFILTNDKRNK